MKISQHLEISPEKILFIGDSLFEGGNDYSVLKLNIKTEAVKDIEDTKNKAGKSVTTSGLVLSLDKSSSTSVFHWKRKERALSTYNITYT